MPSAFSISSCARPSAGGGSRTSAGVRDSLHHRPERLDRAELRMRAVRTQHAARGSTCGCSTASRIDRTRPHGTFVLLQTRAELVDR